MSALPLRCSSRRSCRGGRLVLFDGVFDVMAGIQALRVRRTGSDNIIRRGATCRTWNVTFSFDQVQMFDYLTQQLLGEILLHQPYDQLFN